MKVFVLFCAIALYWKNSSGLSTQDLIQEINSKKTTWKVDLNFAESFTPRVFLEPHPIPNHHIKVKTYKIGRAVTPENFDARDQWPACRDIIDNIRDQGYCSGGWAFSATEVMSDRLCIQSKGELKFQFSAQDLISCCSYCGSGCGGGWTSTVWTYWQQHGIVSGGDYNSNEGCKPYEALSYFNDTTPTCRQFCQNENYKISYSEDKRFGDNYYRLAENVQQIQTEIMKNGPVQASIRVFEDFTVYKEGVYQHVSGEDVGGHAVKIIGWGSENGVPYWLVANSLGTEWANLKGYFKIRRGYNESGIESNVIAGRALIGGDGTTENPGPGPAPGGSAIKGVSFSFALFLVGLILFAVEHTFH